MGKCAIYGIHERGLRVKLTKRAALGMMKPSKRINWYARRGVVTHCNWASVIVKWDDRASGDSFPVGAVEPA